MKNKNYNFIETKWVKICSNPTKNANCLIRQFYSNKYDLKYALEQNKLCKSCSLIGRKVSWGDKISESNKGQVPWNKGLINGYSEEARKNMRLSSNKRRDKKYVHGYPNHNSNAISMIEQKAKELGITDLQHAENGGEFQVCGYFVDGCSKEKNTVIEYYEKAHKYKKERDERRKKEIIKELGCKFIEIWE